MGSLVTGLMPYLDRKLASSLSRRMVITSEYECLIDNGLEVSFAAKTKNLVKYN